MAPFKGNPVQVYPYFDQQGDPANQKLRLPDKSFPTLKAEGAEDMGKCQLFGQHVYGERYDRKVVVCEGELDALSVAQVIDCKFPVVSVNSGSGNAKANLQANYLWLDRFQEIYLWFDDDEAGKKAVEECAPLFAVGKVKVVRAAGFKDASDCLQADKPGDIEAALFMATTWKPRGILNGKDTLKHVLSQDEDEDSYQYPAAMAKLQEMTGGIFMGDVDYDVAGTGVGKSTQLREIQYALLQQGVKIGVLSFEDTVRSASLGLMSIEVSERLHLRPMPKAADTKARAEYDSFMRPIHEKVFGSGQVELFDAETAEWSLGAILGYIRYMAKALECKAVFIDPLSFVIAGVEMSQDERRVVDKVAAELAKLAKELNIYIRISHHLKRKDGGIPHEEGATPNLNEMRSSGNLANFATAVIGWRRNNQALGDSFRVVEAWLIKTCRRTGKSGLADTLYYTDEGRLIPSPIPMPPPGKPDTTGADHAGDGKTRNQPFGRAADSDY